MANAMPPLRIIAQPKKSYRERYGCEINRQQSRAQRFIRAADNDYKFEYPTIEIPQEWKDTLRQDFYIRLTLSTIPTESEPIRYIHPYPINTEDTTVIRDISTNSLYFRVSENEFRLGRKTFQFTLEKLTQYMLRELSSLKPLIFEGENNQCTRHATDLRSAVKRYRLEQSQLLFSIATFKSSTEPPIIYRVSNVFSNEMIGRIGVTTDDSVGFRCSPLRGDWQGHDEILMVIPKIDKRKPLTVYFYYPCIGQSVPVGCEFVDAKTISLFTPKCLVTVTRDNPTILVSIVVCQNETEIAKIDFTYQALNECVNCSLNVMPGSMVSPASNKRSITDSEEDNEFEFPNVTVNRAENNEDTKHSTIKKC
ncbi:unnamed protein product [Adineta steineri]|uniref:RHD domain-containing protein n=1 Tax=Adineta steineri TaxID=433720 RepID=A0A815I0D5_9BILA|nr:unnamed protein product [Adineta steineri]CAF3598714.1 unnamed protein product [Adineta steineri]